MFIFAQRNKAAKFLLGINAVQHLSVYQCQQIYNSFFYRNPKNPKADMLVKALLNEEEATMPLPATSKPYYYRWNDFKKVLSWKIEMLTNLSNIGFYNVIKRQND